VMVATRSWIWSSGSMECLSLWTWSGLRLLSNPGRAPPPGQPSGGNFDMPNPQA
jgi:hypothetical protein